MRKKAHNRQQTTNSKQQNSVVSRKSLVVSRKLNKRKLTISLAVLLVILTVFTQLAPNLARAASNSWGFGGDLTGYEYDAAKVNIAASKASLTNPGNVNGANMNLSPKSGVTSDGAAQFTRANKDYLTVNSNVSLQTGDIDFEVGAWVYVDSVGTWRPVITKWNSGMQEYSLTINSANQATIYVSNDGTALNYISDTVHTIAISTWYYVRGWHDSVNNVIGVQVGNNSAVTKAHTTGVYSGASPVVVGSQDPGPSGVSIFDGRIDSAYFKKSITSSGDATLLYNNGAGAAYSQLSTLGLSDFQTALTSWWDLNEESGTRIDAKGTNHLTSTAVKLIDRATYGAELIQNPGFETAGAGSPDLWTNWTESAGGGTIVDTTTAGEFHSGAHAAKITLVTGLTYVLQNFSVTAAQTYYFAFWTRGDGTNAGKYNVQDNTHSTFIVNNTSTGVSGTTYALVSGSFTAPAGCLSVAIVFQTAAVASTAYFDDVSVKNITYAGLLNGGLDTWTTATDAASWTETLAGTSTVNDETAAPYANFHSLKFITDASNSSVSVYQNNVVAVGGKYKATFWAKRGSAVTTVVACGQATSPPTSTLTDTWTQYTHYFTPDSTRFLIGRSSSGAANQIIYVDSVTLESIGPLSNAGIATNTSIEGNYALGFDGINDSVNVPYSPTFDITEDITLSAWFKPESSKGMVVFEKGDTTLHWEMYYLNGALEGRFKHEDSTYTTLSGGSINVGQWYFGALVNSYDGLNSTISLYLNGALVDSDVFAGKLLATSDGFTIGKHNSYYFNGKIDDVRVYNRTLTNPEITNLYNNTNITDSLVSQWNFEEGAGINAIDSVSGNNGTITGATYGPGMGYYNSAVAKINDLSGNSKNFTQTAQTKRPVYRATGIGGKPAMQFDGVDDALVKTGDQIGTGNVTVMAVIKPRGYGGGTAGRILDNSKFLLFYGNSSQINLMSDGGSTRAFSANSSITNGSSYLVSVTRTSAGVTNFYINGALSGTADQPSGITAAGSDTYIGNKADGSRTWDGWIGPVMTFGSILGDSERNQVEKSLGATYGVTVASTASTAVASPYPTLSTKSPFHYTTLQNFTENLGAGSTGTMRYQISNDPVPDTIAGSTWYWYNGASWTAADKYNGWQGNTAAEVDANIGTFHFVSPANSLKMRAFFVTDGVDNPILSSIDTTYVADTQAPSLTTLASAKDSLGGSTDITSGNWNHYTNPSFTWNVPADPSTVPGESSSGLAGYLVYWGTDNTANIDSASVIVGQDRVGYRWQSGTTYTSAISLVTNITYYLKVIPVDNAGNAHMTGTPTDYNIFTYRYDNVIPTAPLYTSVTPSGYSQTNHFVFNWPVVAPDGPTDTGGSALAKFQYRIGTVGVWTDIAGDETTSTVTLDDAAALGLNTFNLVAVDAAGNQSNSVRTNFYFNNTAPTAPPGLTADPETNTENEFSFNWDASAGEIAGYYYSVNAVPTLTNAGWTEATELPSGPYATIQGQNILYVVAKDNAGNYDFSGCSQASLGYNPNLGDTCAAVAFTANTSAPGIPGGVEAYDISVRDTSEYTVAIKYHIPDYTGTGFAGYDIYRSIDNIDFVKVGTTTSTTYLDDSLESKLYYYYVKAKDDADQYSAPSSTVSITPTGKYTSPPTLVSGPTFVINPTSIDVTWATDRVASSFVAISLNGVFVSEQGDPAQVTDHRVKVVGLKSQNSYDFNILSTDVDGNTLIGATQAFNTAMNPSVYELTVDSITQSGAIINFKSSAIANFILYYGETANYGSTIQESSSEGTQNHNLALSRLNPGTMYYFRVTGYDAEGNELRSENSFSTVPLPKITNFAIEPVKDAPSTTLKVTWESNVPTTTVLKYALDAEGYKEKSAGDLARDHEITISDLADQHTYTLYATGMDQFGNVAESDRTTFDTPKDTRPPKITDVVIESNNIGNSSNSKAQVAVSWKTDELANSYVEYGVGISGTEYTGKTTVDQTQTNHHLVIISDLEPGRPYHLRVVSADTAGNTVQSTDNTVITGDVSKSALQLILNTLLNVFGWMGKLIK